MKKIYTIYTISKLNRENFGNVCVSSPGWFTDLDECRMAVTENRGDIWETINDYICIQESVEGLYSSGEFEEWYEYDRTANKYMKIPTPSFSILISFFRG